MTEEILALMKQKPGIYLFGDTELPGRTLPVVVMKEASDLPGHIYALEPNYKVEASAEGFKPTTFLAGGPYSVQQAEEDAERDYQAQGMEHEADYFRDLALRAEKHLRFARSLQQPKSAGFIEVTDLIERIENYRRSRAIIEHSEKMANPPA